MEQDSSIRSISRALAVLRAINRAGSMPMTEIAKAVNIPYPTALRIVRTLVEEGVIEREEHRKWYRPTALIQGLSYGFQNHDLLVVAGRPHIVALTHDVQWPISIVTRAGHSMVVRDSTSTLTPFTFNHYYPGWLVPIPVSASGRAFLANSPPEVYRELITYYESHGAEGEVAILRTLERQGEAERIRQQGYAVVTRTAYSANPGKTSSIAVPLFQGDKLLGTLTLVFFAAAMPVAQAVARFVEPLRETAQLIGADMAVDVPSSLSPAEWMSQRNNAVAMTAMASNPQHNKNPPR